eukprot:2410002-Prymnesium_polylepis.1
MASDASLPPLTAGAANVTSKNLTRALSRAGARGLFLGFSAAYCSYCAVHEAQYAAYAALAASASARLPALMRVDAASERALLRRHEIDELPALVLAWSGRWTAYTGPHRSDAIAEFGEAQRAPLVEVLKGGAAELEALSAREQRRGADGETPGRVLLLGLFGDLEEEEEELEDLREVRRPLDNAPSPVCGRCLFLSSRASGRCQTAMHTSLFSDPVVRRVGCGSNGPTCPCARWRCAPGGQSSRNTAAAAAGSSAARRSCCSSTARPAVRTADFETTQIGAPSPALLRLLNLLRLLCSLACLLSWRSAPDPHMAGGAFRLDEARDDGLDLGGWAAAAAVPLLGELTGANFKAYAATELPMLMAFVKPQADNRALKRELRAVAGRFRGKLATVWCDGEAHATKMLSLGLSADTLPQ